ncbi:hypothetical protein A1O1_04975 [Capronia coronata CBS 617.96]|uniref:Rhodopsin domain-containing protein n=1 Tax=Capronia coronata CBS 617.96 TaxID=1182541 RepID=W9Y686_9EURO|nr:uncharacterized protein A1O1_04975 [Capronia coronata CBS 617.96]EXJ88048.1 hypothetical protein A1O1_04975 [Capronia coronata CBS 617.96]
MFVKHAWLTFYYGLARTRWQTYFIHFMQFVAAGFGISSVIVILAQCIPLSHVWHAGVTPADEVPAKCINLAAFLYANAIIMIVNDVIMYLIPMVLLRNVDMVRPHRWGVYALFAVGGLVVVASIMRLVALVHLNKGSDVSENCALVLLWAGVENHIGICAACAGAIKQKSIAAVKRAKTSYSGIRSKSHRSSSALISTLPRTQSTEERALYERADSLPNPLSSHDSKSPETLFELHEVPHSPSKSVEYQLSPSQRFDV